MRNCHNEERVLTLSFLTLNLFVKTMNIGYLRVSTDQQSVDAQKSGIIKYCNDHGITIEKWVEEKVSGVKAVKERKLGGIIPNMHKGDTLLVAELSRLGRSVSMITRLIEQLLARKIKVVLVKQNMILGDTSGGAMSTMLDKMFISISALFAEMERELIVARVKEGIQCKIASGFDWGSRTRGLRYKCKTDIYEEECLKMMAEGTNPTRVAKRFKVSWSTADCMIRRFAKG